MAKEDHRKKDHPKTHTGASSRDQVQKEYSMSNLLNGLNQPKTGNGDKKSAGQGEKKPKT